MSYDPEPLSSNPRSAYALTNTNATYKTWYKNNKRAQTSAMKRNFAHWTIGP